MSHEITKTDRIVLHKHAAWHGLGKIVEDAPTPTEALKMAELDWTVEQWDLEATKEHDLLEVPTHVANVRSDTNEILAVVGSGYQPVQNAELAEFAEALAEQDDTVTVESAGSIMGGRKVWFLLKGESFEAKSNDIVEPYILVSNGHDGLTSLRCTPTTVRVVCSNTLHMVIPRNGNATRTVAGYNARHVGNIEDKIEHAKAALGLYGRTLETQKEFIGTLAARDVTREEIQEFWLEVYQEQVGAIPKKIKNGHDRRKRDKATEAFAKMGERFDTERNVAGATAWNAFNAFTGWQQNDKKYRSEEARINGKMFARTNDSTVDAFASALETFA